MTSVAAPPCPESDRHIATALIDDGMSLVDMASCARGRLRGEYRGMDREWLARTLEQLAADVASKVKAVAASLRDDPADEDGTATP
jgi:hypothetical protein